MFKKINAASLSIFHHDSKIPAKHSLFSHKPVFTNPIKRNYYADTVEKTPIIPTKIISQQGHVGLHLYKQFYPFNQSVIENTAEITAKEWQPFLSLNSDGIIQHSIYQEHSNEMEMVVSTGNNAPYDIPLEMYPSEKEKNLKKLLNILYRIPQDQWEAFIATLPDQQVTHYLKLIKHRHLLWAYNYVTEKSGQIRLDRAKMIGEYHFLMMNEKFELRKINSRIDQGNVGIKLLEEELGFTKSFIRKIAHCPLVDIAGMLEGRLVLPTSVSWNGKRDKKKFEANISKLPSSELDPNKFSNIVSFIASCTNFQFESTHLKSILFFQNLSNARNISPAVKQEVILLIDDYLKDLFRYFVFAEFWRFEKKLNNVKLEGISEFELSTYRQKCFDWFQEKYWGFFNEKIAATNLFKLQERWHRNLGVINAVKPSLDLPQEWPALFEKITIDNVTFESLSSQEQLKQEGDEMSHCVAEYAIECNSRKSHILRVVSSSNERTTMQITIQKTYPLQFVIRQHFGKENCTEIPTHMKQAAETLIAQLNNGDIKPNPLACEIQTVASHTEPFPFDNMELQEEIFQVYLATKVLPPHMIGKTYSDMLEKSGLTEFVKQVLNIATPKLPVKKTKKLVADRSSQVTEHLDPTDNLSSLKEQPQQASSTNKHGFFDNSCLSDKRFCRSNKPNMLYEVSSIMDVSDSTLRDYGFDPEQCRRRQIGIDNFIDIYASKELAAQARLLVKPIQQERTFQPFRIY